MLKEKKTIICQLSPWSLELLAQALQAYNGAGADNKAALLEYLRRADSGKLTVRTAVAARELNDRADKAAFVLRRQI